MNDTTRKVVAVLATIALARCAIAQQAAVKVGDKVPDYVFKSLENADGRISMAAMRGRVVLVDFWGHH